MATRQIALTSLYKGYNGLTMDPNDLTQLVCAEGADGIDLVTVKFWEDSDIRSIDPQFVCSFQGPWNDGDVRKSFNLKRLRKDYGLSPLYDYCVSGLGSARSKELVLLFDELFPMATATDCIWLPRSLCETQPHTVDWQDPGRHIALDTFHILQYCDYSTVDALNLIQHMADRTHSIHFQWRKRKHTSGMLTEFMSGEGYLHDAMHTLSQSNPDCLLIVELNQAEVAKEGFQIREVIEKLRTY